MGCGDGGGLLAVQLLLVLVEAEPAGRWGGHLAWALLTETRAGEHLSFLGLPLRTRQLFAGRFRLSPEYSFDELWADLLMNFTVTWGELKEAAGADNTDTDSISTSFSGTLR